MRLTGLINYFMPRGQYIIELPDGVTENEAIAGLVV